MTKGNRFQPLPDGDVTSSFLQDDSAAFAVNRFFVNLAAGIGQLVQVENEFDEEIENEVDEEIVPFCWYCCALLLLYFGCSQ